MDLYTGLPFWLISNGLPFDYPRLDRDISTEVVILGGGITAAIQAFYLIEAGIPCVLIEKRSIGLGSTCATTAMLQYQIDTPLSELMDRVGPENAKRAYRLCAETIPALGKISKKVGYEGFSRKPSLFLASYKKDVPLLKKEFELYKAENYKVAYWDEAALHNKTGLSYPAAILSDHSGQIDAYMLCHLMLQYCLKKGLQVYDRSEITDIQHSRNGVRMQCITGHQVNCKKLIYAVGYEVVEYLEKPVVQLESTWAIVSRQMEKQDTFWYRDCLIWESKVPYLYIRTTNDNRIMLGGRDEPTKDPKVRADKLDRKSEQLAGDFAKMFPDLEFVPEFSWAGAFGSTKDGLPYIGRYGPRPNGLFALGFGGNGITFSVIAAEIIRDLIQGKPNADEAIFSFER